MPQQKLKTKSGNMSVATYSEKADERVFLLLSTPARTMPVEDAPKKESKDQKAHMIWRSASDAEARAQSYRVAVEAFSSDRIRTSYIIEAKLLGAKRKELSLIAGQLCFV